MCARGEETNCCRECGGLAPAGWDLCLTHQAIARLGPPADPDAGPPEPPPWRLPPDDALKEHLLDAQPLCPDCRLPFDEKARLGFARLALDPERARGTTWWDCAGCMRPVCGRLMGIAYRLT